MGELQSDRAAWSRREPFVQVRRDADGFIYQIVFHPAGPDVPLSFQRLRANVIDTESVVKTLLPGDPAPEQMSADTSKEASPKATEPSSQASRPVRRERSSVLQRLSEIAQVGWEGGGVAEANVGIVIVGTGLSASFALRSTSNNPLNEFNNWPLVGAGAAVGYWLSYAFRRPRPDFRQLLAMEVDRRGALTKLLVHVVFALVVGLLLITKIVTVTVGAVSTEIGDPSQGKSALIIGIALGLMRPILAGWVPDIAGAVAASSDRARLGVMQGLSQTVEDLLADFPHRATEVLTTGEAGQALTRSMTESVSRAMEVRLAAIPVQAAEAITEGRAGTELKRSVAEGVRSALTPPAPVNWHGSIAVEIGPSGEPDGIVMSSGRPVLQVVTGGDYEIRVAFVPNGSTSGAGVALTIEDGEEPSGDVPFELRVDTGLPTQPVRRRNVQISPTLPSEVFIFPFRIASEHEFEADYPISVAVYQHGARYVTSLVGVELPSKQ